MTKCTCLCQLCSCGHHQCVPARGLKNSVMMTGKEKITGTTTYEEDFPNRPWEPPRQAVHPISEYQTPDKTPIESTTMYTRTYIGGKSSLPLRRLPLPYIKSSKPMDSTTAYNEDFTNKGLVSLTNFKPVKCTHVSSETKMEANTTNKEDYRPFLPDEAKSCRQPIFTAENNLRSSSKSFDSATTSKTDFVNYGRIGKLLPFIHKSQTLDKGNIDTQTTYKTAYYDKEIPERITHKLASYKKPTAPMKSETTAKQTFVRFPYEGKRESCKPTDNHEPSSDKFVASTTFTQNFQKWPVPPKPAMPWAERGSFVRGPEAMETRTSYMDEFLKHSSAARNPKLPKQNGCVYGDKKRKLDGHSTYKADFDYKAQPRRTLCKPEGELKLEPTTQKNLVSTQKAEFTGIFCPPAVACKPAHYKGAPWGTASDYGPPVGQEGTSYGASFKQYDLCSAEDILQNLKGGKYEYTGDKNGHKFYLERSAANRSVAIPLPYISITK